MQNSPAPVSQAETLLDQIHQAILAADFAALMVLSPELERAFAGAAQQREVAVLRRLKTKAERNAACLLAAGRGVRAAKNRITELREISAGSHTYNGRGQRTDLGTNPRLMGRF
jgi:predicted membrane metal-binding protein